MTDAPILDAAAYLKARYPLLERRDDYGLINAVASMDFRIEWRDFAVRYDNGGAGQEYPPAGAEDAVAALELLGELRERLDGDERRLIDMARRTGVTWPQIAKALRLSSAQGAQQRHKRLEGRRDGRDVFLDPQRAGEQPNREAGQ